jgi:hypothetical protein
MSDNPSFVLKGILDVEIQQKPVPDSESIFGCQLIVLSCEVDANEVLVEVKKTGAFTGLLYPPKAHLRLQGICGTDVRGPLSVFLY